MKKNFIKLSELPNETEISIEESHEVITAGELRQDLERDGDLDQANAKWLTIRRKQWKPNAQRMITSYIEQEYDDMYEDWDERAMDCVSKTVVDNLQQILDEAFKSETVTEYWSYEKDVIIDTTIKGQ